MIFYSRKTFKILKLFLRLFEFVWKIPNDFFQDARKYNRFLRKNKDGNGFRKLLFRHFNFNS